MKILGSLVLLAIGGCLLGCTTTVSNSTEAGLRWGTEVTFFSRAAKTADEKGVATITIDDRLMPDGKAKDKN